MPRTAMPMPATPATDGATHAITSQREHAYATLRHLLILQQLREGERLREPEWARRLGVHRTALREAFARLEAEGMIERGSRTGYVIPMLSDHDLAEVTKLRIALESLAIDEICAATAASSPQRFEPLVAACDLFEQLLHGSYSLALIEADRRFHQDLIELADMKRLSMLYRRAPLPIIHRRVQNQTDWRRQCEATLAEHRSILAALQRGDAAEAKRVLRRHLDKRSLLPLGH